MAPWGCNPQVENHCHRLSGTMFESNNLYVHLYFNVFNNPIVKAKCDLPVPSPYVVVAEYFDGIFDTQERNLDDNRKCAA